MLLRKSVNANELEKNNIDVKLFWMKVPAIKVPKPKYIPRNNGIRINENGIKYLKLSSNVNE